jgi:hypothetical protein
VPLRPGRTATVQMEVGPIRTLAREDLPLLAETRPKPKLQSLRDNHHRIARAVASGLNNTDVAALCGISVGRVSQLLQDPAFTELTAHYRSVLTADWTAAQDTVTEFLGSVRTKSLAMLEDKLVRAMDNDELLPTRELVSMAELGLDRTGYGKQSKNLNIHVDFAAQLEAARSRSSAARVVGSSIPSPQPPAPAFDLTPSQSAQVQAPSQFRRRV